jgi:hypothetical protein
MPPVGATTPLTVPLTTSSRIDSFSKQLHTDLSQLLSQYTIYPSVLSIHHITKRLRRERVKRLKEEKERTDLLTIGDQRDRTVLPPSFGNAPWREPSWLARRGEMMLFTVSFLLLVVYTVLPIATPSRSPYGSK